MIKVSKFGGTSMADKKSIERVVNIIKSDTDRKFVIVSAPGKRFPEDEKITDLLYQSFNERFDDSQPAFNKIRERYITITKEMGLQLDIEKYLDEVEQGIEASLTADYAASRGEYLCALIFADLLGWQFIDAAEIIKFNSKGQFDSELTNDLVFAKLQNVEYAVIGGFYGSMPDGTIKTFSRGGSDITGAIIARGVKADIYENWTDVNGFMSADPRVIKNPMPISVLSYEELRELSYMGASVLHPESIFPLRFSNIPINVRNTFDPENSGTTIVNDTSDLSHRLVTGIAGKSGYVSIQVKKSMMNNELGFARKVLSVLENNGVSLEHAPTGIDTMSIIIHKNDIAGGKEQKIIEEITSATSPDKVEIIRNIALIAIVGHGMAEKIGTAARVFGALSKNQVNVRMINQGSSEMNIIVGVAEEDMQRAISALYAEFFN
jgi:aspartate kinase